VAAKYIKDTVIDWIRSNFFPRFEGQEDVGLSRLTLPPAYRFDYLCAGTAPSIVSDTEQIRMDVAWIVERVAKGMSDGCPERLFLERFLILIRHEQDIYIEQHGDANGTASRTFQEIINALGAMFQTPAAVDTDHQPGLRLSHRPATVSTQASITP